MGSFAGGLLLGNLLSGPSYGHAAAPGVGGGSVIGGFFMFILSLIQIAIICAICYYGYIYGRKWYNEYKEKKAKESQPK